MFVYTRPSYVRVRKAFPEKTSFWVLKKACLDSDIPRLTESRLSNSRVTKSGRNSRKQNKSGCNGFASGLSIVQEESKEDEEPSAESRAKQRAYLAAFDEDNMEQLNDMNNYSEDVCGPSGRPDCNTPGVEPSSERSEDIVELQASLEVFQPAGRSLLRSRMGMDGLLIWY
jgi:hypothetical protein